MKLWKAELAIIVPMDGDYGDKWLCRVIKQMAEEEIGLLTPENIRKTGRFLTDDEATELERKIKK